MVLLLALVYLVLRITNPGAPQYTYFDEVVPAEGEVLVIAHRGGVNLWPENTIYGLRRGVELGADVLEIDVRGTADDRLVLLHDETVDRTTNGTGALRELTLAEVQALDAGYEWPDEIVTREAEMVGSAYEAPTGDATPPPITSGALGDGAPPAAAADTDASADTEGPADAQGEGPTPEHPYRGRGLRIPTLEEVLAAFPDVPMVVELKETNPVLIDRFVEILREADRPDRTLLATFYPETMNAFRERLPEYPTSAVQSEIQPFVIMDKIGLGELYRPPSAAFQVPEYAVGLHVVTPSLTRTARRLDLHIEVWSAGSWDGPIVAKPDLERLIDAGVDGIITDRPDLLLEVLGRR